MVTGRVGGPATSAGDGHISGLGREAAPQTASAQGREPQWPKWDPRTARSVYAGTTRVQTVQRTEAQMGLLLRV